MSLDVADARSCTGGSVTECLDRAKQGESYAQYQLWERYLHRLLTLARDRLRGRCDQMTEPDDVAQIVFNDFLRGIERGRFQQMDSRDDLWQVLVMLTRRKSVNARRRGSAKKRNPNLACASGNGVGADAGVEHWLDSLISKDPTPLEAVLLTEEVECRISVLENEKLQHIAIAKMRGFNNQDIAIQLGCSLRSVERKLSIIRRKWAEA